MFLCMCVLIFQLQPVMALFINGCTRDHANTISITVFSFVCVCMSVCVCVCVCVCRSLSKMSKFSRRFVCLETLTSRN